MVRDLLEAMSCRKDMIFRDDCTTTVVFVVKIWVGRITDLDLGNPGMVAIFGAGAIKDAERRF